MTSGKLIILNGGSSNGKTSTCEHIQNSMDENYMRLGIDRFWAALPPKQINLKTCEPHYMAHRSFEEEGKPYFQIIPGIELDRAMYGSYRCIRAYLEMGVNVISDQIFWKPEWFIELANTLQDFHVFYVGMFVSDEEGSRREDERRAAPGNFITDLIGFWPDGWHRNTARLTHRDMVYDLEIDNTNLSKQETADNIITAFKQCDNPTALEKSYAIYREKYQS